MRNRPVADATLGSGGGGRNTNDESLQRSRKAVNPYTWLVCAKIVKCGKGEMGPTDGSIFSEGHDPTEDSAFSEGFESTESSAFGVGHELTQDSDFGERRESTQTDH